MFLGTLRLEMTVILYRVGIGICGGPLSLMHTLGLELSALGLCMVLWGSDLFQISPDRRGKAFAPSRADRTAPLRREVSRLSLSPALCGTLLPGDPENCHATRGMRRATRFPSSLAERSKSWS